MINLFLYYLGIILIMLSVTFLVVIITENKKTPDKKYIYITRNEKGNDNEDKVIIWSEEPYYNARQGGWDWKSDSKVKEMFAEEHYKTFDVDQFNNIFGFIPEYKSCQAYELCAK